VNLTTASKEVIAAATGMTPADAGQLVQARQQTPFKTLADAKKLLPSTFVLNPRQAGVASQFFEVRGQLRLGDRVLQERSLVQRRPPEVVMIQRERVSLSDPGS
jgi:general secretion pathway protein K